MAKLFLRVGVLAFGSFIFVGGTHAALRGADAGAMSVTSNAPKPSCAASGVARMLWTGDMTTLDPQPLPPKVYGMAGCRVANTEGRLADGAPKPAHSGLSCA